MPSGTISNSFGGRLKSSADRGKKLEHEESWQERDKTISKGFVVAAGKSFSDEKKMFGLKGFLLRKAGLEKIKRGGVGVVGLTKLQGNVSSQRGILSGAKGCLIGCINRLKSNRMA